MKNAKAFFTCEQALTRLVYIAQTWAGTPFIAHAKTKRNGVDCVHLCAEIYKECGLFADYTFPDYTVQGGQHSSKSKVEEWLKGSKDFQIIKLSNSPLENPGPDDLKTIPGDLLLFTCGKSAWHVGIAVSPEAFVHCMVRRGVIISQLNDPRFKKTISAIYRPIKENN